MRELKIEETKGVCGNAKFQTMLEKGLITSEKAQDHVNEKIVLIGSCKVNIKTDDKDFNMYYYITKDGLVLSSGSEYLFKSLENVEFEKESIIKKVQTKRGFTYLFNPVFSMSDLTSDDDLPL